MNRNWYSAGALIVLGILFLALTIVLGATLRGWRADLTENNLYTLSPGTVNLLESLEEPVTLDFYFSRQASEDLPQIRRFARRVDELLDEMAVHADGNLRVRRVDPRPFSEEEDEAARYGLEAVPVGGAGDDLYLGVVGTNMVDGLEVLPFLSPQREELLEYELARMIYVLSQPDPLRVGLISGLDMSGGVNRRTGQRDEPWAVFEQMQEMFDIESIRAEAESLPDDIDALVVVHPADLGEELAYAIDQFVLSGGRLLAFVDPYAEADTGAGDDPMAALSGGGSSSLETLFGAWGVRFDRERFVADPGQALQVNLRQGQRPVRHPAILGVSGDHLAGDDVITGELDAVNIASAGHFELAEDSPLDMTPLMTASDRAGLLESGRLQFLDDPSSLMAELGATGEHYVLAARLRGEAESAFARDGDGHVGQGPVNAVIVGDSDLLTDQYWVQRQRFFGTTMLEPFAGNGDFVINAIDNLLGNADLISVRSRSTSSRPFTLVETLRREAEQDLLATEQQLEAELAETERRLGELQQARGDSDLSVLTSEQEAEIDRFMEQRLEIRRQLRQVRHDLDRDIEALGRRVKLINIALMPVLVTGVALVLAWRRRRAGLAGRGGDER